MRVRLRSIGFWRLGKDARKNEKPGALSEVMRRASTPDMADYRRRDKYITLLPKTVLLISRLMRISYLFVAEKLLSYYFGLEALKVPA
jgi:hypothetical protein